MAKHRNFWPLFVAAYIAVAAAIAVITYPRTPAPTFNPLIASHSVVALWDSTKHGGVIVAPGIILTAYHVVDEGGELTAETYDGATFPVTTTWTDKDEDLALVSYSADAKEPVAKLSCDALQTGEAVAAIGHPEMKAMWAVTWGHVASVKPSNGGIPKYVMPLDLTIIPGNSGGPIFNERGEVVAIADALLVWQNGFNVSATGISYGVPVERLCKSLPRF